MAAARGDKFIEILANVLRLLILESISLREQLPGTQLELLSKKRRDVSGVSAFDKSLIFQLLPFVLTHGSKSVTTSFWSHRR